MIMKDIKTIFKENEDDSEEFWSASCEYDDLLSTFEHEVILKVDDNAYQGDSRVLLKKSDDEYGLLVFGWGSCSGCDALQGCDSIKEVEELRDSLYNSIIWKSKSEMLDYFKTHDWVGDFAYDPEFVGKGINILEGKDVDDPKVWKETIRDLFAERQRDAGLKI